MLFLASTDQIRVVTGSGVSTVNMYAAWADVDAAKAVTVGRGVAAVTTATTTNLVGSPASGSSRNVKRLNISNDSASPNVITVSFYDGSTAYILESITLAAGERLGYEESTGFRVFDSTGREKSQIAPVGAEQNNVTADQTISGVDAYILGSDYNITGRLKIGSVVRWTITMAKTDSAGSTAPIFNIRVGTAGAIGDTARGTMTGKAQTAVPDVARVEIAAHVRVVGSSSVWQAVMGGDHGLATTGMSIGGFANQIASSAFDATPANTKAGVSINPGSSSVWVVKTCSIEGLNLLA